MLSLLNFFKIDIPKNRIFGLDLLRTIALLVLFGHSKHFLPINIAYFLNKYILIDGVGLFFVLSSFLIGGIFIKDFEKKYIFQIFHFCYPLLFISILKFLLPNYEIKNNIILL